MGNWQEKHDNGWENWERSDQETVTSGQVEVWEEGRWRNVLETIRYVEWLNKITYAIDEQFWDLECPLVDFV